MYELNFELAVISKQGRKRPIDMPKRMIEKRRERERKVEEEI